MLEIYTLVIEASVFTLLLKLSHRNNVIQKLRNQNKEMTDTVGPYIYSRNIDSVLDSFVQRQISCFLFLMIIILSCLVYNLVLLTLPANVINAYLFLCDDARCVIDPYFLPA